VITLLASPESLAGSELTVAGDSYRHLFRARRTEVGERLRVVDGRDTARWGEVVQVAKAEAQVRLEGPAPRNEPDFRLTLCVPTCRPERAAWLVEKATELGVFRIVFLHTERAPRELGAGAAVEQCHRTRVTEITGPHAWKELPALIREAAHRWVLDTAPTPREADPWGDRSEGSGALLVGPEGGWTEEEREELKAAGWRTVHLGDRVLRLETAAIAGAALVLCR
jgi:16S rRNA (uracil1498-N3)-methyltransferase